MCFSLLSKLWLKYVNVYICHKVHAYNITKSLVYIGLIALKPAGFTIGPQHIYGVPADDEDAVYVLLPYVMQNQIR